MLVFVRRLFTYKKLKSQYYIKYLKVFVASFFEFNAKILTNILLE